MKYRLMLALMGLTFTLHAQFKTKAEIRNYSGQNMTVRMFTGASDKLINKIKADGSAKFSVKIPQQYSGIVRLETSSGNASLDILSDNEDVEFTADYETSPFSNVIYAKGKPAMGFQ